MEQMPIDFDKPMMTEEQRMIYSLLRKGRANARTVETLSVITSIHETRLRAIVKHIIERHHILICSATSPPAGYYLPQTKQEYAQGTAQLVHRIRSMAVRLRAMDLSAYEELFGQRRLDL